LKVDSLNSADVFILDSGLTIYQFNGGQCNGMVKIKATQVSHAIKDDREGKPQVLVLEESGKDESSQKFFETLGSKVGTPIKAKGADETELKPEQPKLFEISDLDGKIQFKLVAEGSAIKRSLLKTEDAFILDAGNRIIIWVGAKADQHIRKKALGRAQHYLTNTGKPAFTPITRCSENHETHEWETYFKS